MWFSITKTGVELYVFAKPGAKKTQLVDIKSDALHIAIHAKPKEGEANKVLIAYLSALLGVPKTSLMLKRGEKSRHKTLLCLREIDRSRIESLVIVEKKTP